MARTCSPRVIHVVYKDRILSSQKRGNVLAEECLGHAGIPDRFGLSKSHQRGCDHYSAMMFVLVESREKRRGPCPALS
ncbi:hypothetical protein L484_007334 [Morus notabilis]|uniref:Uncharacterized protein n=1 Tax=Morus notabilis TaxID=981085 RepID=W9R324_9ROSA|nr:hypothetical protein L484_007334 [Morus notabilis]